MPDATPLPFCSFCNADTNTAFKLISGPRGTICDRCLIDCLRILAEELVAALPGRSITVPAERITAHG